MSARSSTKHRTRASKSLRHSGRRSWVRLGDEQLLKVRLCNLKLRIERSPVARRVRRLYRELAARGLKFRPHFWLAEEWFTPDGVPGIAIPFYLAHPRLMKLERRQMLEVEGGSEESCMRILRHEAGHAIDNAFGLHRLRRWQKVFGRTTQPYPDFYQPRPYSRSYVLHLDSWYAQSHPAEDFAESFAVWLKPKSRWRVQYDGWPAIKKLEFVDSLMKELRGQRPPESNRRHVESISGLRKTLGDYYTEKRARYAGDQPNFYDRDLHRLFPDPPPGVRGRSAAAFLGSIREEVRRKVAFWTGEYQYTIDQVLGEMIKRCRELGLVVFRPRRMLKQEALILLTVNTMNYLHAGYHRVAL